jgi:hypothetical protein
MTGVLTPIIPKLARLIPRLASPFDGEVVATVHAIERALKSKGLDFNDLATAVNRPEPPPRIVYRDRPAPAGPVDGSAHRSDPDGLHRDRARLQWLLRAPHRLTGRDRGFLISLLGQIDAGRAPSFKQSEWLADIYVRAGREFA